MWQALGSLPGEKLAGVLNIVAEGKSVLGMANEELELDIDQLDDDTLLKLEKYTTGILAVQTLHNRDARRPLPQDGCPRHAR